MIYLILFTVGVLTAPILPASVTGLPIILSVCFLSFCGYWFRRLRVTVFMMCAGVSGACLGLYHVQHLVANQLPEAFEGTDQTLTYTVTSLPTKTQRGVQFIAEVDSVQCEAQACGTQRGQKIKITWYRPAVDVLPGEQWRGVVRLKRPRGLVNPGGFDYHAWLLGQRISATGYLREAPEYIATRMNLARIRFRVRNSVFDNLQLSSTRFFKALLVGDKADISTADWQVLQRTGTIHLMAISGLHIGLIAGFAFVLGQYLARFGALRSQHSNVGAWHFVPLFSGLMCAVSYAALAGFTLPTLRAFIACACVSGMLLFSKNVAPSRLFIVALFIVSLTQPFAVVNSGFWLSFLAVMVLLYSFSGRARGKWQMARAQWALLFGLAVPLLMVGQGVSWLAPVANVVAVPVVGLVVVPLLFIGALASFVSPWLCGMVLHLADRVFHLLWQGLQLIAGYGGMWWPSNPLTPLTIVCSIVAIVLLLAPVGLRVRMMGALLLVATVLLPMQKSDSLRVTVLDVGQGLAVVVQSPAQTWVYDTGVKFSDAFDTGRDIVSPYLRHQGVEEVDLIVSHSDADHAGGALGLVQSHQVNSVLSGEPSDLPVMSRELCHYGIETQKNAGEQKKSAQQKDAIKIQVLWPQNPGEHAKNNASCVVLVTAQLSNREVKILLPGDVDKHVEAAIMPLLPDHVDVLIAPHHGSKTSSSQAFIGRLNPDYVVFSAGYKNRYHHPNQQVVERYLQAGSSTFNTAHDGAITFTWDATGAINIEPLRKTKARVWY